MTRGVTSRPLAVGIEDRRQVQLHVGQVVRAHGLGDLVGHHVPIGRRQAHHRRRSRHGQRLARLESGVPGPPLRMLPDDRTLGIHDRKGEPQPQAHPVALDHPLDAVQPVREVRRANVVAPHHRRPPVIQGEDVESHSTGQRDHRLDRCLVDVAEEVLPRVVDPRGPEAGTLRVQDVAGVGRDHSLRAGLGSLLREGDAHAGGRERLVGRHSPLEREHVGVVHQLDAALPRPRRVDALHDARNLVHRHEALTRAHVPLVHGGVVDPSAHEQLAGLNPVEGEQRLIVGVADAQLERFQDQVGQDDRLAAPVVDRQPLAQHRMAVVDRSR